MEVEEEGGDGHENEVLGEEEEEEEDEDGAGNSSPTAEISSFDVGGNNKAKSKTRARKLTPILASPKVAIAPLKAVCELQIIEEGDNPPVKDDDLDNVLPMIHLSPRKCIDGQVRVHARSIRRFRRYK